MMELFPLIKVLSSQVVLACVKLMKNNPYFKTINDDEGGVTLYTERPLTQEMIDLILQMDGIKSCDADTQSNVWPNLEIFKGKKLGEAILLIISFLVVDVLRHICSGFGK